MDNMSLTRLLKIYDDAVEESEREKNTLSLESLMER